MKRICLIFSISPLILLSSITIGQQSDALNVAIVLYNGIELLDFSGPGEVFAATKGFNTYTVAISKDAIVSQGFVKVMPEYTIFNCPDPDIVVLSGGGTQKISENESAINWIKSIADNNGILLSVCTGAFILSKAGLLDGKKATTWHGAIERLQEATPKATILRGTRFVDNGRIITTAGVSAGIDGALHLVSKIKGMEKAEKTAKYMEYDKWEPKAGLIIENGLINQIRNKGIEQALKLYNNLKSSETNRPPFYEGELINLGNEYLEKNEFEDAVKVFELNLKAYPNSEATLLSLAKTYESMDKSNLAKKFYMDYLSKNQSDLEVVNKVGFDETIQLFETLDQNNKLKETNINLLGYRLLQAERIADAIKVFMLNVNAFPESWNVYDSAAEAYMLNGENQTAVKYYKKSLEINPDNENAKKYLTKFNNQYN
jgi:putative intracellular protease/amidase